jgi:hypothetical protein
MKKKKKKKKSTAAQTVALKLPDSNNEMTVGKV